MSYTNGIREIAGFVNNYPVKTSLSGTAQWNTEYKLGEISSLSFTVPTYSITDASSEIRIFFTASSSWSSFSITTTNFTTAYGFNGIEITAGNTYEISIVPLSSTIVTCICKEYEYQGSIITNWQVWYYNQSAGQGYFMYTTSLSADYGSYVKRRTVIFPCTAGSKIIATTTQATIKRIGFLVSNSTTSFINYPVQVSNTTTIEGIAPATATYCAVQLGTDSDLNSAEGGTGNIAWDDLVAGLTIVQYQAMPLNGLLAEYLFTNSCLDSSGNGINGTATNIVYSTGKSGSCGSFNGATSYFVTNNDYSTLKSLSLWIYPKAANGGCIAALGHTSNHYAVFSMWISSSSKITVYFSGYVTKGDTPAITLNTWHHIVVTNDSVTSGATNLKVYVDGAQVTLTTETSSTSYTTGTGRSAFGGFFNNQNYPQRLFYNGSISNMRMYNRILTADEVATLYSE